MAVSDAWRRRIDGGFQRNLADWPLIRRELAALFPALSEEEALCLRAVYAGLGPQDLASIPAGQHLEDVRTALWPAGSWGGRWGRTCSFSMSCPPG